MTGEEASCLGFINGSLWHVGVVSSELTQRTLVDHRQQQTTKNPIHVRNRRRTENVLASSPGIEGPSLELKKWALVKAWKRRWRSSNGLPPLALTSSARMARGGTSEEIIRDQPVGRVAARGAGMLEVIAPAGQRSFPARRGPVMA
ncbi:hypothetical protein PGT21_015049 [Puccinia graminis f. sp. tritici]|uniref:Uncharacterized protein n=1 Tax=Puccinia graminis f. sp. tritici TaxID=56615 RepID=A0A5B0QNJ3_PUCGR|nr:hypothetical protein PGT21_015049 [Puccinia graminis f. sp. tritici]